jgi:hypothetical protein
MSREFVINIIGITFLLLTVAVVRRDLAESNYEINLEIPVVNQEEDASFEEISNPTAEDVVSIGGDPAPGGNPEDQGDPNSGGGQWTCEELGHHKVAVMDGVTWCADDLGTAISLEALVERMTGQ